MKVLKKNQKLQNSLNIPTQIYDQNSLLEKFPYLNSTELVGGSYNNFNEGYFDSSIILNWWRKKSFEKGVEFIKNEVVHIGLDSKKINAIYLKDGSKINVVGVTSVPGVCNGGVLDGLIAGSLDVNDLLLRKTSFEISENSLSPKLVILNSDLLFQNFSFLY